MILLNRNLVTLHYCLYSEKVPVLDEEGYETGEYDVGYGEPVAMRANVSAATGQSQVEQFGNLENYDKVVVTDDMTCPIDENTVLFIDKEPAFDSLGKPQYDYTVKRVAKSLNSISIAVSKVKVS